MSNGAYKTACGYTGTESGTPGGGPCGQTSFTDSVSHIANPTYFAAYKDDSAADPLNCGLCAEISYGGHTIVATIVDDCASCDDTSHLDLSMSAANALGLTPMNGDPTSGVTWKAVSCPVSGDIVAVFNVDAAGQLAPQQVYFQNVVFPVMSASIGGRAASYNLGYWDFGESVAGQSVTLTDVVGHSATGTVPTGGGSIQAQFSASCQ
jgi:hypothetical protein